MSETLSKSSAILITGASGFVGRHLIQNLQDHYQVVALARRTQKDVNLKPHPNVEWNLVDITDPQRLTAILEDIAGRYRIEFIIHLAAYYDFGDQVNHPQYEQTNVEATRYLLAFARGISIKRFIFASSVVASRFPEPGKAVRENSALDASFPYALTKRRAEKMLAEYQQYFPCTVVRLAAVFSDWCEYEPLYHFLKTWLSERWDAAILPGQGKMSIPYIHICCVVEIFRKIINQSDTLPHFVTLVASSDDPVSLAELHDLATRHFFGRVQRIRHIPVLMARLGVLFRDLRGRVIGGRPFERQWMLDYTDKIFQTDSQFTRRTLAWAPKARHSIRRRILHLIENLKSRPVEWHHRNQDRLRRFSVDRPALILAEELMHMRDRLMNELMAIIYDPARIDEYPYHASLEPGELKWFLEMIHNHLLSAVRHGDRSMLMTFGRELAETRISEGVSLQELNHLLSLVDRATTGHLYEQLEGERFELLIHDYVTLAIQLAVDEIKDVYEDVPT